MSVSKKACCDTPVRTGLPVDLFLPGELWQHVAVWWPNNYELAHITGLRTLCRAFAEFLKYRVYAHNPNHVSAITAMRLMYTYNRRLLSNGTDMYSRAMTMVYCRMHEVRVKVSTGAYAIHRGSAYADAYFHALVDFMETKGQLMPPAFDGFVARIHHNWARYYTDRKRFIDLKDIFAKVREGHRQADDDTDWMHRGPVGNGVNALVDDD